MIDRQRFAFHPARWKRIAEEKEDARLESPTRDNQQYNPKTLLSPQQKRKRTRIFRGIIEITAIGITAWVAGAYLYANHFEPNRVEAIYTNSLEIVGNHFGELKEIIQIDVTGDHQPESVRLYSKGYAFYSQESEIDYLGRMYHRIHSGTPEAERLWKVHPWSPRDSQGW